MPAKPPCQPTENEGADTVAAARSGSLEAQETLSRRFQSTLESVVRVRMGTRLRRFATPEDIAQEAMVNALKVLDRLREGAGFEDFRAILLKNAEWLLLNLGRRARGFVGPSQVAMDQGPVERAVSTLTRGPVTRADDRRWLEEKIARLDDRYAEVLRLHLEGKNIAEIADEMGLLEDAARKRHKRAIELLKLIVSEGEVS